MKRATDGLAPAADAQELRARAIVATGLRLARRSVMSKHFAFLVAATVATFAASCHHVDIGQPHPITTTTTAATETRTPPLPLLVIRLAQSELPLDVIQEEEVDSLVDAGIRATWPLDVARTVFLDRIARDVERGRPMTASGATVIEAARKAAPAMRALLARLHEALSPSERAALVGIVRHRVAAWAPLWSAAADDHGWIPELERERFVPSDAIDRDMAETARGWVKSVLDVAAQPLPDEERRRDLAVKLRADSWRQRGTP